MKKKIIVSIVVLFVVGLLAWRLWGDSYDSIVDVRDDIHRFEATVKIGGVNDGKSFIDSYTLESKASEESMKKVLKMLKSSKYQNDWRNLLPWHIDSVSGGKNNENAVIVMSFYYGTEDEKVHVQFLSEKIVVVDKEDSSELRIYHPTNKDTLRELAKYIKKNGKKNEH